MMPGMQEPNVPGDRHCTGISPPAPAEAPAQAPQPIPTVAHGTRPLSRWLVDGLRANGFALPRHGAATPTPWQLIALVGLAYAVVLGLARLQVSGPAEFSLRSALAQQWPAALVLWFAWWAMAPARQQQRAADAAGNGGLAAWFVLFSWAALVPLMLAELLLASDVRWPALWQGGMRELAFGGALAALLAWALAALVVVSRRFIGSIWRTGVFSAAMVATMGFASWQFPEPPWMPVEQAPADVPQMVLSQQLFEAQQALWQRQVQALAGPRSDRVEVYGLVFAPFASENVFRRESTMVRELLEQRFDARGRVVHLLNHAETATTHVWATPQNLQRAVAALGARMDRERDVLVVYMTSHGGQNHQLAASHWPLDVPPVGPEMLRQALDEAGIRNRVIAVSACYSGGWVEPLASDDTLVMTAADATHTSYGCGSRSELTFFGRAVFDEQLRTTWSFTDAFARAVPVIAEREVAAGKEDGFSNPQMRVGTRIAPVLEALALRLSRQETVASANP